jgi:hypothetical protein
MQCTPLQISSPYSLAWVAKVIFTFGRRVNFFIRADWNNILVSAVVSHATSKENPKEHSPRVNRIFVEGGEVALRF